MHHLPLWLHRCHAITVLAVDAQCIWLQKLHSAFTVIVRSIVTACQIMAFFTAMAQ